MPDLGLTTAQPVPDKEPPALPLAAGDDERGSGHAAGKCCDGGGRCLRNAGPRICGAVVYTTTHPVHGMTVVKMMNTFTIHVRGEHERP